MRYLLVHPIARTAVPAIAGAVVGLMTNFVAGATQVGEDIDWSEIPRQGSFWIAVAALGLAILYQTKVFNVDRNTRSVLEESKEGLAEKVGNYYADKIEAGEIDELVAADKKLRKIFQRDS